MLDKVFTVKYITSKNCFCHVSDQSTRYLHNEGIAVKLNYGKENIAYFSPRFTTDLGETEIGINRLQAELLNVQENDHVLVSLCQVSGVTKLVVSPSSKDDYEILELLARDVELLLLNQIRVVAKDQKFVIWITDSLHITVNVDAVEPVNPGRLDNLTELVIAQPNINNVDDKVMNNGDNWWSFNRLFPNRFNRQNAIMPISKSDNDVLEEYLNRSVLLSFTLHPVEDLLDKSLKKRFFNVFIHKAHARRHDFSTDIFSLKVINPPHMEETNNENLKEIIVRVCLLDERLNDNIDIPIMYVNNCIFKQLNIKIGAKAYLDKSVTKIPSVNEIEISTTLNNSKSAVTNLKRYLDLDVDEKLVLNDGFIINNDSNFKFKLRFFPACNFCVVDPDFIRNCKFRVSDLELVLENTESTKCKLASDYLEKSCNFDQIIGDAMRLLKMVLLKQWDPENILIVGKPGAGKSTSIGIISEALFASPFYIHSEIVSCKNIKGKSMESLAKMFAGVISNLVYYQPSVLILDDLHVICQQVNKGDVVTQEALHFTRVSEMLADLLETSFKHQRIAVLATSESASQLNEHIFASRGQHLFKSVFSINELVMDDRFALLEYLFSKKCLLENVDLEQICLKTEGFVVQDLVDFVDRALFNSLKDSVAEEMPQVTMAHCEQSLQNTTPLSLRNIQLHSCGERDFSDVGGLETVKKILIECMMWPLQYPHLFGSAPLRLQSGLLLYGPPGTGKTILAGAAAKHCNLRLISIKGPELLSKYIGASEQAVRNIFEKAQSAKPCILFFDEFDSLAPRRGHDSTGVTDRVVNQLLTQLDGIESLQGVFVLAATSRPDLLDPALLRPGRLDTQVLCPLPDKEDRLEILRSLSKHMTLNANVDLLKIAEGSVGYTGADLQSVLYTAQLSAVEYLLEEECQSELTYGLKEITQQHLEEALNTTRPSLTAEEHKKYQRIYASFQQGNDLAANIKTGVQKATLA